jgi:hypothetical protein
LGGAVVEKCSAENVCGTELGEIEEGMLYKEFLYENSPHCRKQSSIAFNCLEISGLFSDNQKRELESEYEAHAGVVVNECPKENVKCAEDGSGYGYGRHGKRFYYESSGHCAKQNTFALNYADSGYCLELSGVFSDKEKREVEVEYKEHAGMFLDECPKEGVACAEDVTEQDDDLHGRLFYYESSGYCVKPNIFAYNFIDYGYCFEVSGIFNDRYKAELESEFDRHPGAVLDECPKENVKCTDAYEKYERDIAKVNRLNLGSILLSPLF